MTQASRSRRLAVIESKARRARVLGLLRWRRNRSARSKLVVAIAQHDASNAVRLRALKR